MMGRVVSLNISGGRKVEHNGQIVGTGIFKEPVAGRVMARRLTLDGDKQVDLRYHGGEHKAIYAYPHEHYATWARELGRSDFGFGQFGENLTTEGLLETTVHLGDRFRADAPAERDRLRRPEVQLREARAPAAVDRRAVADLLRRVPDAVVRVRLRRDDLVHPVVVQVHSLDDVDGQRRPVAPDRGDLDSAGLVEDRADRRAVPRVRPARGAELDVVERIGGVLDVDQVQFVAAVAGGAERA